MKTFQFYIKKTWFGKEKNVRDTFYFLTSIASRNTASGIVLTLYGDRLDFYYSTKDSINAMTSLYQEVDEQYIQNILSNELKHIFIMLFFEGINKCL